MLIHRLFFFALLGVSSALAADLKTLTFSVDGVDRSALIYVPAKTGAPLPLVFAFHGHGGTSRNAERTFQTDTLWPDAISIYPQGLPTVGQLTDPQGTKPGWQHLDSDNDRDLHFFDAMLAKLKKDYAIDPQRIYCCGHSNGGGFTYLLWKTHPDLFAAFAISSSAAPFVATLTPKPALILSGRDDPLVPYAAQQRAIAAVDRVNRCSATTQPWETIATLHPSATPLVTYAHDGGHAMDANEPKLIVDFFRRPPSAQPAAATQP